MHIKILSLQYPTDMAIPVINDRRDFRQNELASSANFVIAALSAQLFSEKKNWLWKVLPEIFKRRGRRFFRFPFKKDCKWVNKQTKGQCWFNKFAAIMESSKQYSDPLGSSFYSRRGYYNDNSCYPFSLWRVDTTRP